MLYRIHVELSVYMALPLQTKRTRVSRRGHMDPVLDVCVREPIMDPDLDARVRKIYADVLH